MGQWDRCSGGVPSGGLLAWGAVREDFLEEVTSRQMKFSWKGSQAEGTACAEAQKRSQNMTL